MGELDNAILPLDSEDNTIYLFKLIKDYLLII